MAVPYPQGECFFKRSALKSEKSGRFNAEDPSHFYSNMLVEMIWNKESHHGSVNAKSPGGHPHRRSDYKIVYGGGGWGTHYGVWTELPFTYGSYEHPTRRVQHKMCTWGYRFKRAEWGDALESWFMFVPMPTREEEWVFFDLLAHVRAIYIPIAYKSSEKCPDLCTYVHVRFNSLKDFELEYHQDKTPDQQAHLYDFEKAAVSKKKIVCDKTTGIGPDGSLAIGLNITKLVTVLAIPRTLRKADAFSSGSIIAVDSSLIPLVGVQQTLDDNCMADWTTVASENQGLTIEWGKGSYEGPWFIAWFKDSMTFAIGWIPLIGPFLAIGWSVAFTAIQDPDNLMDTLRSAIPSVRLTEGLIEEFKKGKALVNNLVEDVEGTVKSEKARKSQDQKIEQAAPGPKPEQPTNGRIPSGNNDATGVQESTEESFDSIIASVPSSKAITEDEFKVLAKRAGQASNFNFDEKLLEELVKDMLIYSHEEGIIKIPDNTYGAVSDYNKSVEKQYIV